MSDHTECARLLDSKSEQYVAERKANDRARKALQDLADACDGVGVKHFDTDDMSPEVTLMQSCTQHARAVLKETM